VLDSILPVFEENIKISFSDKQAFFWDNQIQMSITLIEGQFPLVEQIVPKDGKLTATILVPELLSACKQVLLFTGGDWNPATLNFDNGICEISSSQDQSGDSIIQIAGRINENIKTALNTQTLIEFLNTVSENSAVEIYTKLPVTPIVFKIPEKENYLCIAMPIHLG
jgi:DNA polymerase III sliding clamp (beta) subunit (PCNA family)